MEGRKATARKVKGGYKAVISRADGSTLQATKIYADRSTAIASAQLWIENIDRASRLFNEPRKPVRIAAKS